MSDTKSVFLFLTEAERHYLDHLARTGLYGSTADEVARHLMLAGVQRAVESGIVTLFAEEGEAKEPKPSDAALAEALVDMVNAYHEEGTEPDDQPSMVAEAIRQVRRRHPYWAPGQPLALPEPPPSGVDDDFIF